VKTFFDLYQFDRFVGRIELNLAGMHNILNALAAIAVAHEIGISFKNYAKALKTFKGVGRRMEVLFKGKDIVAIDDYGHHPEEIQATLKAIRRAYAGRLVVLFQPHRYSRTRDLFKDFVNSFDLADKLFVLGIYPAGESPIKGVSGQKLALALEKKKKGAVKYVPHSSELVSHLVETLRSGDVFLSLGAGDITHTARMIAKELKKKYE
jgi:UDP-N-acetylmuramate--alanine ligase